MPQRPHQPLWSPRFELLFSSPGVVSSQCIHLGLCQVKLQSPTDRLPNETLGLTLGLNIRTQRCQTGTLRPWNSAASPKAPLHSELVPLFEKDTPWQTQWGHQSLQWISAQGWWSLNPRPLLRQYDSSDWGNLALAGAFGKSREACSEAA